MGVMGGCEYVFDVVECVWELSVTHAHMHTHTQ